MLIFFYVQKICYIFEHDIVINSNFSFALNIGHDTLFINIIKKFLFIYSRYQVQRYIALIMFP